MLMIRFQRVGRRNDPAFRIVVAEKRSRPKTNGVERVGSYHPKTKQTVLNGERILYWIEKGASPSPTVHNLLIAKGIMKGKKIPVGSPTAGLSVREEMSAQQIPAGDVKSTAQAPAPEPIPQSSNS